MLTPVCAIRWEGFKPYLSNHGEIAWRLWIKSRAEVLCISSDGWLNSKGSGSEAVFTFHAGSTPSTDDDLDQKAGETRSQYFDRLAQQLEQRDGEGEDEYRERVDKLMEKMRGPLHK